MEYNIYMDVFFFVNFTMNYVLLFCCKRWVRGISSWKTYSLGAAFGALIASLSLLFIPDQIFFGDGEGIGNIKENGKIVFFLVLLRFLTAIWMGRIAYGKGKGKELVKRGGLLCLCAFALSGSISWIMENISHGLQIFNLEGKTGFYLLFSGSLGILSLFRLAQKEEGKRSCYLPIILTFKGKSKQLMGLYDTGNDLTEPVFGKPVHIAEYEAVKELMPEAYREIAENYFETNTLELTKVTKLQMYEFTFLSYHSIGKEKGQLLGIRMDSAVFITKAGEKTEEKAVIALTEETLSRRGHYQIIINRRLEV
ncbi:MAG: sigma-E processing peptidase SpoIIGA [Lachnospiraceae bacterium]|nr:sigma-E processing peptidase SpoIIGA [Lachnospiraceae bacterium]